MKRVLCFGEALLRLSPAANGEWLRQNTMPVYLGGAELNTATALAKWKIPVSYCTALPNNALSQDVVNAISERGIDTDKIIFSGNRIGSYYLPQGTDLKNAGAIYDRAYSSFWDLAPGQINWNKVSEGISWFHFSAIAPALNRNVAAVCLEAVKAAASKGITVSVDLNYRAKLWQWGKQPIDVMPELVQYCHVVMGNLWAAEKMLGIALPQDGLNSKEDFLKQSFDTSLEIQKRFRSCKQVANTFRFDENGGVRYYATFYQDDKLYTSAEYATPSVVDKVGSGDTFMAGLIYGTLHEQQPQAIVDFAAAAAFDKLFIKGDATTATVDDVQKRVLQNG